MSYDGCHSNYHYDYRLGIEYRRSDSE